jgi:hypothetical protein
MPDEMGSFRIDVELENPLHPGERRTLRSVLIDTGAELSWFPAALLESLGIERRKVWRFCSRASTSRSTRSGSGWWTRGRRRPPPWCSELSSG